MKPLCIAMIVVLLLQNVAGADEPMQTPYESMLITKLSRLEWKETLDDEKDLTLIKKAMASQHFRVMEAALKVIAVHNLKSLRGTLELNHYKYGGGVRDVANIIAKCFDANNANCAEHLMSVIPYREGRIACGGVDTRDFAEAVFLVDYCKRLRRGESPKWQGKTPNQYWAESQYLKYSKLPNNEAIRSIIEDVSIGSDSIMHRSAGNVLRTYGSSATEAVITKLEDTKWLNSDEQKNIVQLLGLIPDVWELTPTQLGRLKKVFANPDNATLLETIDMKIYTMKFLATSKLRELSLEISTKTLEITTKDLGAGKLIVDYKITNNSTTPIPLYKHMIIPHRGDLQFTRPDGSYVIPFNGRQQPTADNKITLRPGEFYEGSFNALELLGNSFYGEPKDPKQEANKLFCINGEYRLKLNLMLASSEYSTPNYYPKSYCLLESGAVSLRLTGIPEGAEINHSIKSSWAHGITKAYLLHSKGNTKSSYAYYIIGAGVSAGLVFTLALLVIRRRKKLG